MGDDDYGLDELDAMLEAAIDAAGMVEEALGPDGEFDPRVMPFDVLHVLDAEPG